MDFLCFLLPFYFQINSRALELHVIGNCLHLPLCHFDLFHSQHANGAIRGLRVNGADDRLSMKAIETVGFQSARKTSKSP
jgi:hypothetical protein